jgi:RecA-family ATPase
MNKNEGLVFLKDVKPIAVKWLWDKYVAKENITMFDGNPGEGKSTLALDIAARVSRGQSMPDNTLTDIGGVVILSCEDNLSTTIVPRLMAAGADLSKCVQLYQIIEGENKRFPKITDIDAIRKAIISVRAKLVIIDPLMGFIGTADSHKDQDVRQVLAPLADLAEEMQVAVIIVRHLNKSNNGSAIYRGGGSIGISGAARSVFLIAGDPNDENLKVFAPIKSNLAKMQNSLSFGMEEVILKGDIETSKIIWKGISNFIADDLLELPNDKGDKSQLDEAKDFLENYLSSGDKLQENIFKDSKKNNIAEKTLRRAKKLLGIKSIKPTFDGSKWMWKLPEISEFGYSRLDDPKFVTAWRTTKLQRIK